MVIGAIHGVRLVIVIRVTCRHFVMINTVNMVIAVINMVTFITVTGVIRILKIVRVDD
jgi:hypothetical protein